MLSIIICSKNKLLYQALVLNIEKTIGIAYELIKIDNTNNQYNIATAYNKGALQSTYNHLLFLHEDVAFITKNWGQVLMHIFTTNPLVGVIGVAGSTYKSLIPSTWGAADKMHNHYNIFHQINEITRHDYSNPTNATNAPVVVIDGVFIATTKIIYDHVKFDENIITHFHGYDILFSITASKLCTVIVTFNINLVHNSVGSFNYQWLQAQVKVHQYLSTYNQPYFTTIKNLQKSQINKAEKYSYKGTLKQLTYAKNIPLTSIISWVKLSKKIAFKNCYFTIKTMLKAIQYRL